MTSLDKYFYKNLSLIISSLQSIDNSLKNIEKSLSQNKNVSTYIPLDTSYISPHKEQNNEH